MQAGFDPGFQAILKISLLASYLSLLLNAWAFKIKQCMRAALRHTACGPGYGSAELG